MTTRTIFDYREVSKASKKSKPYIDYKLIASRFIPVLWRQIDAREIEKLIFTHRELGTKKFEAYLKLEEGLKLFPYGFWGFGRGIRRSIVLYGPQGLALEEYVY